MSMTDSFIICITESEMDLMDFISNKVKKVILTVKVKFQSPSLSETSPKEQCEVQSTTVKRNMFSKVLLDLLSQNLINPSLSNRLLKMMSIIVFRERKLKS